MISNIDVEIKEGGSGAGDQYVSGIHGKIGVSPIVASDPIVIRKTMDPDVIKAKLGDSPLADACIDSIDGGADMIYCVPVKASSGGIVSDAEHTGDGKGMITVSGTANNGCEIIVEILETGVTNKGTFRVSCDGGTSYTDEMTIPLSGEYGLECIGLNLTFADGDGGFAAGDIYRFQASAPTATNAQLLAAAETLYRSKANLEYIHIVGTTTAALWAALETMAMEKEKTSGRPLLLVCEQRGAAAGEDAGTYVEAIRTDCKGAGRHICVVAANGRFVRMDGRTQEINLAGYICGMVARAKESSSIAYVRDFAIRADKLLQLLPAGIEEYLKEMDEARYLTVRQYAGKDDWFVASANTCEFEGSDFATVEQVRVMYRMVREVYKRATEWLSADIDSAALEAELVKVQADLNVPVDAAVADQIISAGAVTILDGTGLLQGDSLPIRIQYTPRAYVRSISLTFVAHRSTGA